jgi:hypothetical protein
VDCVLAGHHLKRAPVVRQFDPETGYCLLSTIWQGCYRGMILTTDLQFAGFEGGGVPGELTRYRNTLPRVPLLLKTGRGVAIGDTPGQVCRKLGLPTRTRRETYSYGEQLQVYIYTFAYRYQLQKWRWTARYTFRRNRLWAMEFMDGTQRDDFGSYGRSPCI